MALQPYFGQQSLMPYSVNDPWSITPFGSSMLQDPLMQRSVNNARAIVQPINPILATDILDMGDYYELHCGKIMLVYCNCYFLQICQAFLRMKLM